MDATIEIRQVKSGNAESFRLAQNCGKKGRAQLAPCLV